MKYEQLLKPKKILRENWKGYYTVPSQKVYPFQWSWDSAFIAIGLSYYDQENAKKELISLFKGQWENGMLPHIVMHHMDETYSPGPGFWQTDRSENAPQKVVTSGIIQPPLHATAALWIYQNADDKSLCREFLSKIYPKLKRWHYYLKFNRDPFNEGLLYIEHPWESGQDNSPLWDRALQQLSIHDSVLPHFERSDNILIDRSERPSDKDYKRYAYLVYKLRDCNYDDDCIKEHNPFLIQDVLFNVIWCRANKELSQIARILGEQDDSTFQRWAEQTEYAINNKLWSETDSIYLDFDLLKGKTINKHAAAGFTPLYAAVSNRDQSDKMLHYMNSSCFCRLNESCLALPSYDKSKFGYNRKKYWRGPIWLNINWIIYKGLQNYNYDLYADWVKKTILTLPQKYGFQEYYDPESGTGYGASNFSWSAALYLAVLYEHQKQVQKNNYSPFI